MNRRSKQSRRGTRASSSNQSRPPPFQATVSQSKSFRFQASSALTNTVITFADLQDLMVIGTGTTSAYDLWSATKLNRVTIWGPMGSSLEPVTVSVQYPSVGNAISGPSKIKSDTSMGSARCAFVDSKPPAMSSQAMWQTTQNETPAFVLNAPAYSIVDVHLSFVFQDAETPVAAGAAVSGATLGKIYLRALDSYGSALLAPLSYPTI